ncbi:MtrB/PioB family decaheme-associated outer membrane protein [Rhodomicrobium vannielii ATCC 17100]|uniref:MtrB/PioB family decaheme-associated outer membrane protein n=1 Tax=Rhodomicrobium vannielii TaxID=1069 RepID=UPI00191B7A3F|nr:MtrB/PioB family decaheme-associated outer membrane protein [Rhodomicrobium vannielii]MBJ7534134.1 MtrB/PioB family decaheme-associated outer membrane protein [Rhodomicrobium vannielii ATCC 17100]
MEFHGRIVLTSLLSIAVASIALQSARAGDKPAPAPAEPAAEEKIELDTWGDIEFGGRYFKDKPKELGSAWTTATINRPEAESIAKYEEYGNVPQGFYFERLTVGGQTKDAEYAAELRATDLGNNNQRYLFDWFITGTLSGTVTWDQIPHLHSTTAQSIWSGVGTTYLAAPRDANININTVPTTAAVASYIQNNTKTIRLGIDRDRFEADQRWTPTPNWEVRGTYFHERREGTQIAGTNWGGGGGPVLVQVPRPVADTTQNAKASGERSGEWAYGKYNVKLTGSISTFDNDYKSFTVENPFSEVWAANGATCASTFTAAANTPCSRISLMPSNEAYTGNMTAGIDLPFRSRFMNTVQYTAMRQNDPFQDPTVATGNTNTAITGITNAATSLNGEVNALLVNNVLNTRITDDLKSTLRYRYYDNDNQTPVRTWNWVSEDGAVGAVRQNFGYSYTKQNASGDLTYHVLKNASVGGSAGWERIDRDKREALRTDELIGKVYGDARWDDIGQLRASYQYSERRFDNYDPESWYKTLFPGGTGGNMNPWGMRKFDLADRDREKAMVLFTFDNIPHVPNLSLTPSFGLRNDNYLTDPTKILTDSAGNTTTEMGLLKDNSWNAGIEGSYSFGPGLTVSLAYVREEFDKDLVGSTTTQNSATGIIGATAANLYFSNMKEDVDTFIVGTNFVFNDRFDISASYSIALGKEDWTNKDIAGTTCAPTSTGANCAPWPTVNTTLQRIDAQARYKLDPELITQLGFEGDVFWKLKYSWDRSRVDNWQNDLVTPYMYLVDNTARNISMASYNPNYDIHAVSTSLNFKW